MGKRLYIRDTNGDGSWHEAGEQHILAWPLNLETQASGNVATIDFTMKSHHNGVAFPLIPLNGMEVMYYDHDANGVNQHVYWFAGFLKVRNQEETPEGVLYQLGADGPDHELKTHIPHIQFDEALYPTEDDRVERLFAVAQQYGLRGQWDATSQVVSGGFVTYPADSVIPFHRRNVGQILDELRAYPGQPTDPSYPVPVREMFIHGEWSDPGDIPDSGIIWYVHYYSPLIVQQEIVPLTDRPDRMADYVADTFDRTDHPTSMGTADTYQAWSALMGTFGIDDNQAQMFVNGATGQNVAVIGAGVYDSEVQITLASALTGQGLAFRVTSHPPEAYKWQGLVVRNEGGAGYALHRYQAGTLTQIGSTYATTPAVDDVLKVVLAGSSIKVYLNGNGTAIIDQTSSFNATATHYGPYKAGAGFAEWDDFTVRAQGALHYGLKQLLDSSNAINIQAIAGPGSDPVPVRWANEVGVSGEEDGSLTKTATTLAWDAGAVSESVFTEDGGLVGVTIEETWKVSDNFDRPDNNAEIGQAGSGQDWAVAGSGAVWGIETGRAKPVSITTEGYAVIEADVSTGIVQTVLSEAVTGARLIARYTDANNHYYLQAEATTYKLYRRQAGVNTQIGTVTLTPADGDILKLVCTDQTIQFYHATTGNTPSFQFQATGQSFNEGATRFGLGVTSAAVATRFDDFNVWQTYSDMIVGLTDDTGVTSHTGINFGWRFKANRDAVVEEAGTEIGATTLTYAVGNAFKVEVRQAQVGSALEAVVRYYKRAGADPDWVEVYTSLVTPILSEASPMYAGGAIYHKGATLPNVTMQRFTYGVYAEPISIGEYGPLPARDVIQDDSLDSETKRKERAYAVFATNPVLETVTCGTLQKYVAGRTLLISATKFNWVNRRLYIPRVKPDWGKRRGDPKYQLTLVNRRKKSGKNPLGYLTGGLPDNREAPRVPTGLAAGAGQQDSPTTVQQAFSWTQTTQGEQYVWLQIKRLGPIPVWGEPVRFSAEHNTGLVFGLVPNAPHQARIQAQGWNGRYSGWSAVEPFVSASLDVPAAPTTITFPAEGVGRKGAWVRLQWPHSTYTRRSGYQIDFRRSGGEAVDTAIHGLVFVPPDQNSVVIDNLVLGLEYEYKIRTLHESGTPGPWLTPSIPHTIALPGDKDPPVFDDRHPDSEVAGWAKTAGHTSTVEPFLTEIEAWDGKSVLRMETSASSVAEVAPAVQPVRPGSTHIASSAPKTSSLSPGPGAAAHYIDWFQDAGDEDTPPTPSAITPTDTVYAVTAPADWPASGEPTRVKVTAPDDAYFYRHRLKMPIGGKIVLFSSVGFGPEIGNVDIGPGAIDDRTIDPGGLVDPASVQPITNEDNVIVERDEDGVPRLHKYISSAPDRTAVEATVIDPSDSIEPPMQKQTPHGNTFRMDDTGIHFNTPLDIDFNGVPVGTPNAHASSHKGGGSDAIDNAVPSGTAGLMSGADKAKLDGIASGATANSPDAALVARANHTGTQPSTTISDFAEAVDDRTATLLTAGTNVTLSYNDPSGTLTINVPNASPSVAGAISAADKALLDFANSAPVTKTGTFTADASTKEYLCNSASAFTATLPAASGCSGREYIFKQINTGVITIDANGSETIDGALTYKLVTKYQAVTIRSNGTNWEVVSQIGHNQRARCGTITAQSISATTWTILNYNVIEYDPCSLVTTGASWKFTAAVAGTYRVAASMMTQATAVVDMLLHRNGSGVGWLGRGSQSSDGYVYLNGSTDVLLAAGDYIDVRVFASTGVTLYTTSGFQHISICKVD